MKKILCLAISLLLLACASDDGKPPSKQSRKYGATLVAEFDVPAETIERFNRQPAPQRKPHESALEATLGAGGETWRGDTIVGAPKTIPYRIVLTLNGIAVHDGDATTAWLAGWRNEQGLTTSKMMTGPSKPRVKAGQWIALSTGSEPMRLTEGKHFEPELQLVRFDNFSLQSMHVQIWSGLGSDTTFSILRPLGIFAIPGIIVVIWWLLRRGSHYRASTTASWSDVRTSAGMAGLSAGDRPSAPTPKPEAKPQEARSDVLARIVPVIKAGIPPNASIRIGTTTLPADDMPVLRSLAGDLVVMYAEDFDDRFEFVSQRRMRELELTPDALHNLAVRNLPARAPKVQLHGQSPRYMVTCGGNFEAALLLHGKLWSTLAEKLPGELLVAVPARDLLFVSSTGSPDAQSFLLARARQELADARHALSKKLFVRRDGRWLEYET
jgi:hypothetical protein